jgi:hypothetical protein
VVLLLLLGLSFLRFWLVPCDGDEVFALSLGSNGVSFVFESFWLPGLENPLRSSVMATAAKIVMVSVSPLLSSCDDDDEDEGSKEMRRGRLCDSGDALVTRPSTVLREFSWFCCAGDFGALFFCRNGGWCAVVVAASAINWEFARLLLLLIGATAMRMGGGDRASGACDFSGEDPPLALLLLGDWWVPGADDDEDECDDKDDRVLSIALTGEALWPAAEWWWSWCWLCCVGQAAADGHGADE